MEAISLLVNLRERNAELEWAAVSREDRCVTTLITAAKETTVKPDQKKKSENLNEKTYMYCYRRGQRRNQYWLKK